jgi:hypothetical protein
VFPVQISDHYPSFVCIPNVFREDSERIKCTFRDHSKENLQKLRSRCAALLDNVAVYDCLDGNYACGKFSVDLFKLYNESCSLKVNEVSIKRLNSPWMTDELVACIRKKHELLNHSRIDNRYIPIFKYLANKLTTAIRDAKRNYFHHKFNSF